MHDASGWTGTPGRAVAQMVGACASTTVLERSIADPAFEPVFAELDRRGSVLYIHPAGVGAGSELITEHRLTWSIGAPIEDTVAIMRLILAGVPSRYPRMRILASHLGGALPMLLQRADNQVGWEAPDTPEKPSAAARRMWFDSVGHGHVPALRAAVESFGADRIVLGPDFPYEAGDLFRTAVTYVEHSGLPDDQTRRTRPRCSASPRCDPLHTCPDLGVRRLRGRGQEGTV